MKDRIEETNMPKITTYRTFDSTSTPSHRDKSQRTVQLPIAEVAPTMKSSTNDQSFEKLADDTQHQQAINTGLKKIESLRVPATSTDFNHIRYKTFFYTD